MASRQFFCPASLLLLGGSLCASDATKRAAQIYPPDASQRNIPLTECARGASTILRSGGVSRSQRHNGNSGEAHFVLESKTTGAVLWKDEYVGEGVCLGYNPDRGVYIIGSRRARGIGVRLTEVRYIDESRPRSRSSAFNRQDIEAFSAVASPRLWYVAFIAIEENDISVFVLDARRDTLKKIGKAPLPPPLSPDELAYVKLHPEVLQEGQWAWMGSFRDSYMQLDSGIIEFHDNEILRISYGADTPYARSPKRDMINVRLGPATVR